MKQNNSKPTDKKEDREKKDEVTPSDPLLRKQPEVREPDSKRSEPIIKVQ